MTFCSSLAAVVAAAIVAGAAQAADPLPQSPNDWLRKRAPKAPAGELFAVPPKPKPPVLAPVAPAPAAPPAIPYVYGGSGRVGDVSLVFLEKQGRSIVARVGDIVDGLYKVEAIERDRAVLRYMPLDVAQVMPFGAAGTPPQTQPPQTQLAGPNPAPAPPAMPLLVKLPDEIPLGRESTFAIGIPRGSVAARATIELGYDAEVLSVSGAKIVRPGRAIVEMSAQEQQRSKELRLKAIGEVTTQTELDIEVKAFDAQGKRVEVHLPQHILSLVEGN